VINPGAELRGVSSPAPCSGAERRDKVLDEVSTAFHGGAAAVQKGDTLPPRDDNNAGLTPLHPCLKAPFGHQKVPAKPLFIHIFYNITYKNKNLMGSDPAFRIPHSAFKNLMGSTPCFPRLRIP